MKYMTEFSKKHKKALKDTESMINSLENERWYYDADFECEYTPFEEDIKIYCDANFEFYSANNREDLFFESLTRIVYAIAGCNADMYYEDFFRPAELITYYFGKIISSNSNMKDPVRDWIAEFSDEYEGDMIVEEYFTPFIKGEKVYHADTYYTGYKDLNRMMRVFK